MYNDENNLYHYTYRKDGTESFPREGKSTPEAAKPEISMAESEMQSVQEGARSHASPDCPPKAQSKRKAGAKFIALLLCCTLLGGASGAGILWGITSHMGETTEVQVSNRKPITVSKVSVDGKTELTDAENYAANVASTVSINSSTGVNVFGQRVEAASSGSGFLISKDGYIVTNHHVVADATGVKVTLYSGETYPATIIGSDKDYDIAVLKINAGGLTPVVVGDSEALNVGEHVLAVGNPLGELTFSMSAGIVSCLNRAINVDGTPFNTIQIDASINPGNSGGPLLNSYGEVVGIISAKYSSTASGSVEGLGFAIPMNDVMAMLQDIMTNGYVTNKPYLGVTAGTMNQEMAQQTGLTKGVYIYSVEAGQAAEKAGLKVGDVITAIDKKTIASLEDLSAAKKSHTAGDTVEFTIYREGKSSTVQLTFGAVPAEKTEPVQPEVEEQNPQNMYPFGDMNDFFNNFFGNPQQAQPGTDA